MIETVDVLTGIVPVVLIVAFILLVVRMMTDGKTGMVDRMKQAVGGVVMLLIALMVVFAFQGGGDEPGPGPDPDPETYTVYFHVAGDSEGYGTVSIASLSSVPEGTDVTVAQTIAVGSIGQCEAAPAADTERYLYAFSGWTGADDASTQAPATITEDTHYFAHFTSAPNPAQFTYTVADGEATVTGWATSMPANGYDLYIPETDGQGHPVTKIGGGYSTWSGAASLRADSIQSVSAGAFNGCSLLASVILPEAVTIGIVSNNFGDGAFSNCDALVSVYMPKAVTIGDRTFYDCDSLESVSLPEVVTVGATNHYAAAARGVFESCDSLASVNLPKATLIGWQAFDSCRSLASVNLPSVTTVGDDAFYGCTATTYVTFGPLTSIQSQSFSAWTFYDANGTTVLSKTAANLANSTFEGVYNALVKVPAGQQSLTREMEQRVLELSAENSLKASMLAELDPELADMDPSDVARMTISEIESMTADDVRAIKSSLPSRSG